MPNVAYITDDQAAQLRGIEWADGVLFNLMPTDDDRWYISEEEVRGSSIEWVNQLTITPFQEASQNG